MFNDLVVQPIFNLLVFIYALLPGHNFGAAIIIFTIIIRLLMWPLVKKQLHHAKAIRELQPELKRIKKEAAGDRQKESLLVMELYKERQISPFSSIGILIVQFIILIGLYSGLSKVISDPKALVDLAYPLLRELGWLKDLAANITMFDSSLFGLMDLSRAAIGKEGGLYIPALILVAGSAGIQYFQSVQLMPKEKDARTLKEILKDAGKGKQADQAEVNAAVMRGTRFFIPALIFVFTITLPAALSLYWLVSGMVAYLQQDKILKQDEEELEAVADASVNGEPVEAEVISKPKPKTKKTTKKSKKRR